MMIELLDDRPQESMYMKLNGIYAWHVLKIDETGEAYGWLAIKIDSDSAGFHLLFNRTIVGITRQVKKDFERMRRALAKYGVRMMIAANSNIEDKRWPKFVKFLGFPEPKLVYVSKMEV